MEEKNIEELLNEEIAAQIEALSDCSPEPKRNQQRLMI